MDRGMVASLLSCFHSENLHLFMCTASLTLHFCFFFCFVSTLFHHILMPCRHSVGDTKVPFCLQSCVKPLEYAISVHELGTENTHQFVGKEPSGLKFNKLSLNEDGKYLLEVKMFTPVLISTHKQAVTIHTILNAHVINPSFVRSKTT